MALDRPFTILLIAAFALAWIGCRSAEELHQSGFEQTFDDDMLNLDEIWKLEGSGSATLENGKLVLQEDSDGVGLVLWTREDWPADMELSFDVSFSNNRGIGVFFFAARGARGEDLFETPTKRTGDYEEYIRGDTNAYSVSFHRYWPTGENNPGANLRRNTGFNLLHAAEPDPMLDAGRTYHVHIRKQGAEIRVKVDGEVIHDYVDEDPLGAGKVGFRLRGDASCRMMLDDVIIRGL